MQNKNSNRVGIVVPTMNRYDFIVRLLNYYVETKSPHTLYIVDSSPENEFKKTKNYIENLGDKLNVVHEYYPPGPGHLEFIYSKVKEKYICFCGDDDYQVPQTLTKCAEFLNENSDYESACGRSVTFRLKWHGKYEPYGELDRLSDYPRYSVEYGTASKRLIDFFGNYFTSLVSVSRTETLKRFYTDTLEVKDLTIRDEILQCCLTLVFGKSKVIDALGFVHQIHDQVAYHLPDMFDWVIESEWLKSYKLLETRVIKELMYIDKIDEPEAKAVFKQAFWSYLNKQLPREYGEKYSSPLKNIQHRSKLQIFKLQIGQKFPKLKYFYKKCHDKLLNKQPRMHYEVLQPASKYYRDFKPVMGSFTGKGRN